MSLQQASGIILKVISKMNKKQIKNLIRLLNRAGVLKDVKRTGWVLEGVKDAESVADHTWRMSLLILLLADDTLDKERLMEMNVIHDLGEVGVGDIKWESGRKVIGDQEQKHKDEMSIMKRVFGNYPDGKKYIKLLKEFNEQKTPEAKFLKQIDKLEMALQALEYEQQGFPPKRFNQFWENVEKYLEGKSLEPIFRELQRMRKGKS